MSYGPYDGVVRVWWSSSDEPLYSGDELSGIVTVGLVQALVEPSVEKGEPRSVERGAGRRELGQHLAAGGALGDHPLDAADLTFDTSKPDHELIAQMGHP